MRTGHIEDIQGSGGRRADGPAGVPKPRLVNCGGRNFAREVPDLGVNARQRRLGRDSSPRSSRSMPNWNRPS
jgi:hypothetical protein